MSSYYEVETGKVEIGCDCEEGLKFTLLRNKISTLNYVNGSRLDLMNAINSITNNARFEVVGRHVSGHPDNYCVYEHIDWWGQRNVDMELLVK